MCLFTQLDEVADLADAFPYTTLVLNHLGMPCRTGPYLGKGDEVMAQWRAGMIRLAQRPNVRVKLGGLGMSAFFGYDFHRHAERASSIDLAVAWSEFILPCIDMFGADRCMFESNFPVDQQTTNYRTLWNAFKRIAEGASDAEKRLLFSGTAAEAYRLQMIDPRL